MASNSLACNILYHNEDSDIQSYAVCLLQLNLGYACLICSCYVDYIAIIYLTRKSVNS